MHTYIENDIFTATSLKHDALNPAIEQATGYYRPSTLSRSLELLATQELTIVAGATDLYPAQTTRNAWGDWRQYPLLDISDLAELRGITDGGNHYRLGALTTWSDLVYQPLPRYFDALKQAALRIGGAQIQNRATVVGNVCNASPAADGIPGLLCLDAQVELCSRSAKRKLPLDEFVLGNRKTVIQADELVTALLIPKLPEETLGGFEKLGTRRYLVISIVMVAALLKQDESGRIDDIRIAIGACSEVAQRLTRLEDALLGQIGEPGLADLVTMEYFDTLTPIDDIRSDANYRRQSALQLTRRLLSALTLKTKLKQ